jgi:hypothetical protein
MKEISKNNAKLALMLVAFAAGVFLVTLWKFRPI